MLTIALLFAIVALLVGAVAGLLDALKFHRLGVWKSFLICVGLLGVATTTYAETMDILPLALLYAAVAGIGPFWIAYCFLRAIGQARRDRRATAV